MKARERRTGRGRGCRDRRGGQDGPFQRDRGPQCRSLSRRFVGPWRATAPQSVQHTSSGCNRVSSTDKRRGYNKPGEDGENSGGGVENTLVEDGLVLQHASVERHIVVFRESTKRVEKQHGILVALGEELLMRVLHEQRVTVEPPKRPANL